MIARSQSSFRADSALVLLLAAVLLRLPGMAYGIVDYDETDFVVNAQMMAHGSTLYAETVDKKPPLLYGLYALFAPLGFEIWPMQLVAMLWLFATAWVTGRAARRFFGRNEAGPVAAWLVLLASAANVLSVNAEILLNLPAACALYLFVRAEDSGRIWNDVAAGVMVGISSLFKHQGGILLFALALASLFGAREKRAARIGALLVGFTIPWLLALAIFSALGHAGAFLEWNVSRNFSYASGSVGSAFRRCLIALGKNVLLGAPVLWYFALRRAAERPRTARDLAPLLALGLTFIPISLGGRFYNHYFLQFAPALALAATPGVLRWLERGRHLAPIGALLVFPVLFHQLAYSFREHWIGEMPCQEPKARAIAAYLREKTAPEDRVFVWGHYTPIYYLSERLPGTRYIHTSLHMGDFDTAQIPPGFDLKPYHSRIDLERTIADLEKYRPAVVVDTAPADVNHFGKVPLDSFPELDRYIQAHYELEAEPAGARVYRRREGA